jgi:uncharacterized protein (TIGR04255 family)
VKYENPPVVETVLSVQFNPLRNFGAGYLGAYWRQLGSEWPNVSDAPAVDPVFEQFDSPNTWERAAFIKLSTKADMRLQIRNVARDRMIQVQNGRFFYNWLRTSETEYPSYEVVRPEFDEQWEQFRAFVIAQSEEQVVQPNQWEILYVNHIAKGTLWNDFADFPKIFSFLSQPELGGTNVLPDSIGGEWRFEVSPKKGRLYLRLGMKVRDEDKKPCIVLTLIARGPIDDDCTLYSGLELGHSTITNLFDRITTKTAQAYWGFDDAIK